jgi:hypothetical protein
VKYAISPRQQKNSWLICFSNSNRLLENVAWLPLGIGRGVGSREFCSDRGPLRHHAAAGFQLHPGRPGLWPDSLDSASSAFCLMLRSRDSVIPAYGLGQGLGQQGDLDSEIARLGTIPSGQRPPTSKEIRPYRGNCRATEMARLDGQCGKARSVQWPKAPIF